MEFGLILQECKKHITINQEHAKKFFKTSCGDYAEKDLFLGVKAPHLREIAKKYTEVDFNVIQKLIVSEYNEIRLLALLILIKKYQNKKIDHVNKKLIYDFYIKNIDYVNNWNLVDSSAHYIVGAYLYDKDRSILFELAGSKNLWHTRIAIVATWFFIRNNDLSMTFILAEFLLTHKHDLIHKATGWMLREAGQKDEKLLIDFLAKYHHDMPKTMLRYSKEKIKNLKFNNKLL